MSCDNVTSVPLPSAISIPPNPQDVCAWLAEVAETFDREWQALHVHSIMMTSRQLQHLHHFWSSEICLCGLTTYWAPAHPQKLPSADI